MPESIAAPSTLERPSPPESPRHVLRPRSHGRTGWTDLIDAGGCIRLGRHASYGRCVLVLGIPARHCRPEERQGNLFGFAFLARRFSGRWRQGASGRQRATEIAVTSTPPCQDHAKISAPSASQVGLPGLQGRHTVTSRAFASGSPVPNTRSCFWPTLDTLIGCRQQPPTDCSGSLMVAGCLTRRAS